MSQPHRQSRSALLSSVRHRTALAAEVFWPGGVALVLAALLACACALHTLDRERTRLQEARWHDVLIGLRQQIEADLALGFDLEDSQRAERLLEVALHKNDELQELSVFDLGGQTLFDTDRSAIGEQVREAWRAAAGNAAWRVASEDAVAVGLPLHGPLGAVVGQITLTLSMPASAYAWVPMLNAALALAGIAALLALLPLARLSRALESSSCAGGYRLDDAEARVAQVDAALRFDPPVPTP